MSNMLHQPTIDKLQAMRLQGMVEALGSLERDGEGLSFRDKLQILVDRRFAWRDNQALQLRLKRARLRGGACVEDIDYRAARGLDRSVVRALAAESNWVAQHQNLFITGPPPRSPRRSPISA